MIALGTRHLALTTAEAVADRACTDADSHDRHAWTDGRRTWSCPGQ